jgi:hypothetical protein
MKKLPLIMGIPALALALVLGGAMVWRLKTQTIDTVATQPGPLPNSVENAGGTKPTNPFSFLSGPQVTPIPTPTPATVAAMNTDLNTIGDDGGTADINSLKSDAGGL